ncbi:MAG: lipopolysaccharide kinase InaA family protein [Muribaculaceae bacterium]|nr:lipopolysaccharide kinase InaA family protein [Muribaculaceae bacterium]
MNITILSDCRTESARHEHLRRLATRGLPDDATVIYRGRNIVAASADGEACIKAFRTPGFFKGLIYGFFRKPKAVRAYENAGRLRSLGINTPEPLGAVICRRAGLLRQSFYICRNLRGWSELRGIEKRPDFDRLAAALAAFMLGLHRRGVLMKDFSQGNILFRADSKGFDFALVDINRMEFGVTDRRRLLDNFGAALDTEEGIRALAEEYVVQAHDDEDVPPVDEIVDIFRQRQAFLWRKRRIKERIRGKKK